MKNRRNIQALRALLLAGGLTMTVSFAAMADETVPALSSSGNTVQTVTATSGESLQQHRHLPGVQLCECPGRGQHHQRGGGKDL